MHIAAKYDHRKRMIQKVDSRNAKMASTGDGRRGKVSERKWA
jgi:hypothetical protein